MEKETSSLDLTPKSSINPTEKPTPTKVIKGRVKERKKSFGERLFAVLMPGDPKAIARRIVAETFIPNIKNTILDAVDDGLDSLLHDDGEYIPHSRSRGRGNVDRTSYSKYYDQRGRKSSGGSRYSYGENAGGSGNLLRAHSILDELEFESDYDAKIVRQKLTEHIGQYGCATLLDLYAYIGKSADYTKDRWGWYDQESVASAPIKRVRTSHGPVYLLVLPEPVVVD